MFRWDARHEFRRKPHMCPRRLPPKL
jgi:hypothetical protein